MTDDKIYLTYDDIHQIVQRSAAVIGPAFRPTLMIAIGGGGFIPARIARTFLKKHNGGRNIPIQAIGLSLYEDLDQTVLQANAEGKENGASSGIGPAPTTTTAATGASGGGGGPSYGEGVIGVQIVRTQWLDFSTLGRQRLLGHRILIVDEVDDTRTTLSYAVKELQKDIQGQMSAMENPPLTEIGIFVVHNKRKPKKGELPPEVAKHYYVGQEVGDDWICYPWEAEDIMEHRQRASMGRLSV